MKSKNKQKAAKKRQKKYSGVFWRRVLLCIIGLVLGISAYNWNAKSIVGNEMPMPFGTGVSVVLSGSMEPTLGVNELVVIRKAEDYEEGDIIVYQSEHELIIHRIIQTDGTTIVTQGDANNVSDPPIDVSAVKGKLVLHIPGVGLVARALKTVPGIIGIILLAIVLMELSWMKEKNQDAEDLEKIKAEIRKLREEQK